MPIPNNLMSVFLITVFGTTQGVDAVARDQALALLEYTGFDNTMVVRDYPQSEFAVTKVRALIPPDHALAAITPGQLAKITTFLRKWNDGTYSRFHSDHNHQDQAHLQLLVNGSAVHDHQSDWTAYTFDTTTTKKLKIEDASTFRLFITHIKTQHSALAYLLEAGPVDNFTKVGKKKCDNLRLLLTDVLTQSDLSHTFQLGTNPTETGLALFRKVKAYFLNSQDVQVEILQHQTKLTNLSMGNYSSFQSFLEAAQQTVTSLKDLGKNVDNLELYTILRSALVKVDNVHIKQSCVSFRAINPVPNDSTLTAFLLFLTTDPEIMQYRNKNAKTGIQRVEQGDSRNKGDVAGNDQLKKDRKSLKNQSKKNRKAYNAALRAIVATGPNASSAPSSSSFGQLSLEAINIVKAIRKEWDDETYGRHSDVNKIFNSFVNDKGRLDHKGFRKQIHDEYKAGLLSELLSEAKKGKEPPTNRSLDKAQATMNQVVTSDDTSDQECDATSDRRGIIASSV
jgi:hypothetical protein